MIDLRSDTVTKPTPQMRKAMAEAEVGDDVYGEDPTVNKLQERAADMMGMEKALFVPSGSMGNQIAINVHTKPSQEVILEADSHIFNYEMATMAAFSGVMPRPIPTPRGVLPVDKVKEAIRPPTYYLSQTGLICAENTHNRKAGAIYPQGKLKELVEFAHSKGIPVHLDGARIFNASIASGVPVKKLVRGLDSVMFCLSKGLGCPVGSMLAGSTYFIEEARKVRKRLGGGMRQIGILAAAGLYALDNHIDRLKEDHHNAKLLVKGLEDLGPVEFEPVATNIIIFSLKNLSAEEFAQAMKEKKVLVHNISPSRIRLVTHLDVSREVILEAAQKMREVLMSL